MLICNKCNSELILKKQSVLVLKYDNKGEKVNVIPSFLEKEMSYFVELFQNQEILISKNRNTGHTIEVNNNIYNIDVEFIWSQMYGINNDNKIMIASNHQVYTMFIINFFNRCLEKSKVMFILSPYVNESTKFHNFDEKIMKLSLSARKLFIIYSLNWKKKTCNWNYDLYKKISKLSEKELKMLNNYVYSKLNFATDQELYDKINNFLMRELNFEKNLNNLKR